MYICTSLQYVTEKAGKAEGVTAFDSEFENLCHQLDQIKSATEHMLTHVEAIVQPNPSECGLAIYLRYFHKPDPPVKKIYICL